LGLNRDQAKMLDFVFRTGGISDPQRLLNSPNILDRNFKRTYRLVERTSASEEEMNTRLSLLFTIRNIIDARSGTSATTSTRQIPENTAAVLEVGTNNDPTRVISSRGDSLVVENPLNDDGNPIRFSKGSMANLLFFTESSKGFSVGSRILDSSETADGHVLQLVHSGQIKRLSKRRFRRRQTVLSTGFYLINVDEENTDNNKVTMDQRRLSGNILDISIGGCSIKTNAPINSGQRLKIEFTREDKSVVVALGEVLRTNRSGNSTVMHIKFLKVPKKSLNSINAIVYEYTG
jgi:hypothetical protein